MKLFFLAAAMLFSTNVFAQAKDVKITCQMDASSEITSMQLDSKANTVTLNYVSGEQESLSPIAVNNAGLFGQFNFPGAIAKGHGMAYVQSPKSGELYVNFACYFNPTTYVERCSSQGGGEAAYSRVILNLNGSLTRFFGDSICSREEI